MAEIHDPTAREQLAIAIGATCEAHGGVVEIITPPLWPQSQRIHARFGKAVLAFDLCAERGWPVLMQWKAPDGHVFNDAFRRAVRDIFDHPIQSSNSFARDAVDLRLLLDNGLNRLPGALMPAPERKRA